MNSYLELSFSESLLWPTHMGKLIKSIYNIFHWKKDSFLVKIRVDVYFYGDVEIMGFTAKHNTFFRLIFILASYFPQAQNVIYSKGETETGRAEG